MRASVATLLLFVAFAAATSMSGLHVVGNNLVNGAGQGVLLHGVNHAGTEYMCSQNRGIVEGPTNTAAFWTALQSWNVNSIRLPLNSICWLNPPQQTIDPQYGGAQYQSAIKSLVDTATSYGLAVILELHWNAPQQGATWPWPSQQRPMPDADHAPAFWTSVATMFKSYSNVLFDLHNEPYPDGNQDSTAAWTCWRDGCFVSQEGYQAVGMTALLNAVRSTGACNVVMLGGVCYANALGSFLQYVPNDTACGNIAASWHVYDWTVCKDQNCWTNVVGPVAAQYPLIVGEIGEGDCSHNFIDPLMTWLDSIHASYLGWTWNTWNCGGQSGGPSLISSYDGTATAFGIGLKNHLSGLPDSYTLAQAASNSAAVNTIGATVAGPSVAGPTSTATLGPTVDTTSTTAAVSTSTTTASTASASTAFASSTTSASSLTTTAALVTSSAASASTLSTATAAVTTATLSTASLSVSTGTISASTSNEATTTNVAASTTSVAATTASATISSPLGGQATQAASATSAASSAATVAAASAATSASTSAAVTASTSATTSSVSSVTAASATTLAVSSAAATGGAPITVTSATTGGQPTGYSLNIPLAHCPEDQRFTDQLLLGLAAFASDSLGRSVSSASFIATVDCDQLAVRVTYVGTDNAVGPLLTQAVASNSLLSSAAFTAACGGNCQDALKTNKKKALPAWAIALIVVGAVFGLVLIGGLVFLCMAAHKRRRGLTEVYSQLLN